MEGPAGSQLTRRGGNLLLAAVAPTAAGTVPSWDTPDSPGAGFAQVMQAQSTGGKSHPRIAMFTSAGPCDVLISWTGGGGIGAFCYFTMTFSARIGIDANNVTISAVNRVNAPNQFFSAIADGGEQTRNARVVEWAQAAPPTTGAIRIPPFAQGLRAVSNLGLASAASIAIRNTTPIITGLTPVISCMVDPAVIGGAGDVQVVGLAAGEIVTLSFDLGI